MKTNYIGPKSFNYKKKVEKLLKQPSLATLKGELQKVFNLYIRLRDTRYDKGTSYFICISCSQPKPVDQMNAGHLWPVGTNEALRYDEDNTNGQCIGCNLHRHGNQLQYRMGLIQKIGKQRVEWLDTKRKNRSKLMAFEIQVLKDHYNELIRKLKVSRTKTT